ncbi:MAG: lipoprotein [Clostridiales bacterium]|nr:lipoprotein [Clostridiales bacterium]
MKRKLTNESSNEPKINIIKKSITISAVGILCVAVLSGCSSASNTSKAVVKSEKQIAVMANNNEPVNNEIALEKMYSIKGIRVMDWIDENTVLVMKENYQYPQIQHDSSKAYPKNFYEYDINTQNLKLIAGSNTDMAYGVLSPDKKHIFYKEGIESNLTGFILNRETGQKVKVTNVDSISSSEGIWLDNNTVIFSEFPQGGIYTADVKGNVKQIENTPKGMTSNTAKALDKVYYTSIDGKLYMQNINGKENKFLKDNIVWLIPSQNSDKLIMVKRTEKTKMVLVVTDLEGNEKKVLAEGTQIFGTNWSPDQSKIAYSTAADNSGKAGLFVSDINTGKTVQLSGDVGLAADPVRWSPSGKRILTTSATIENNKPEFVSYIIKLK